MISLGGWVTGDPLGQGGSGTTYTCRHPSIPGEHVLKRVPLRPGLEARFEAEVAALRRLDHPAIVRLVDAGSTSGVGWIVTARAAGRSLLAYRAVPPLPTAVVLGIAAQIASALAHAHARGVIHRDLKPSNVIVDGTGRVTLLDLGVALIVDQARLTISRAPGTPAYAPPEWFEASFGAPMPPQTAAAGDVYALGVVMVELLTGVPAFPSTRLEVLGPQKVATPHLAAPAEADLVAAMTDRDPVRRPAIQEVAARLEPWPIAALPADATIGEVTTPHALRSGQRVSRYVLGPEIGRGGAGIVYRAWDPLLAREVAIKRLASHDPAAVTRFVREAQSTARLDHPGIVRVLDSGDDGGPFIVMELVEGGDLRERLRQGAVEPATAVSWTRAVAGALGAAHAAGLVHREVKPANVLLEDGLTPRLVDFGLVLPADRSRMTGSGQILGSPLYMAPEQARGEPATERTDVYGLGMVMYEMLAGAPAFEPDYPAMVLHRVQHDGPPQLPRSVPAPLRRVVAKAVSRDPSGRYASMDEFARDLDRWSRGAPVHAPRHWRTGARWRTFLVISALFLGTTGATLGWRAGTRARVETTAQRHLANALEEGQPAGVLDAFLEVPEHQGTRALVRGWLARAERYERAGDLSGAREARAQAWIRATHADDRVLALRTLGEQFAREWDWGALTEVVRQLDALGAGEADLRAQEAAGRRDLAAVAQWDPELAPLARRLNRAQRLGWQGDIVALVDVQKDGALEWVVVSLDRKQIGVVELAQWRDGPVVWWEKFTPTTSWQTVHVVPSDDDVLAVLGERDVGMHLVQLDGVPRHLSFWASSSIGGVTRADLDGDGASEIYVGTSTYERDLWVLEPDAAGVWHRFDAHPATSAANSEIGSMWVGDLDGDGRTSLYARTSAWGGFDVRELRPTSNGLQLVQRKKMGTGHLLIPLQTAEGTRLFTMTNGHSRSRVMWPEGDEIGGVEATLLGPALRASPVNGGLNPLPDPWRGLLANLDGDHLDDLAVTYNDGTLFGQATPQGAFRFLRMPGLHASAFVDLDGDGIDEAVVKDPTTGTLWALGVGTERYGSGSQSSTIDSGSQPGTLRSGPLPGTLPGTDAGRLDGVDRTTPTPDGDEPLAQAWAQAQGLAVMGLEGAAERRFAEIAAMAGPGSTGSAAWMQCGQLASRQRHFSDAAAHFARAAEHPEWTSRATLAAARAYAQGHAFERAMAALSRLPRSEWPAEARDWADKSEVPILDLSFAAGLDPEWIIEDALPLALDRQSGTLQVRTASDGLLARLPIRVDPRRSGIEVDATLQRFEWGATLAFATVGPNGFIDDVAIRSIGGGGRVTTTIQPFGSTAHMVDQRSSSWDSRMTLRVDAVTDPPTYVVDVTGLAKVKHTWGTHTRPAVTGADHELQLYSSRASGANTHLSAALHTVRLVGAERRPGPERTAEQRARWALVAGHPLEALDGLRDPWERAVALDQLGRWEQSEATLRSAALNADRATLRRRAAQIMQSHPRLVPAFRNALGDRWPVVFLEVWGATLAQHPEEPHAHRALIDWLGPLPNTTPPEVATQLARLRASALRMSGQPVLALEASDEAVRWAGQIPATANDVDHWQTPVAAALREAAACRVNSDPEAALALLRAALDKTPAPELLADAITVDTVFEPLHDQPGWRDLEAARRYP